MMSHELPLCFMVKLPFWMWDPKKFLLKSLDESPSHFSCFNDVQKYVNRRAHGPRTLAASQSGSPGWLISRLAQQKMRKKTMVSWVWNIINVHNSNFTRKKMAGYTASEIGLFCFKRLNSPQVPVMKIILDSWHPTCGPDSSCSTSPQTSRIEERVKISGW